MGPSSRAECKVVVSFAMRACGPDDCPTEVAGLSRRPQPCDEATHLAATEP